jgi:hypothetical protein
MSEKEPEDKRTWNTKKKAIVGNIQEAMEANEKTLKTILAAQTTPSPETT